MAKRAPRRRLHRTRKRGPLAFTLIELMVVVAIISFLAAVIAPMMIGRMDRARQGGTRSAPRMEQTPPSASAIQAGLGTLRPPHIESSAVRVGLRGTPVIEDGQAHTRYDATFTGTFLIRNTDPRASEIAFVFPFPPGMSEAREVALRVQREDGTLVPAGEGETTYEVSGIRWQGRVAPGRTVAAVVSYAAQGRDAFIYDAAQKGRASEVHFTLNLDNIRRPVVPDDALQPTEVAPDHLRWDFTGLITNKSIMVELPAGRSPTGRLILLCQLAGLAVLLFGAGFWYLNEGRRPGGLDDFRWGHFLLLALTYSLFFGAFAVLGGYVSEGPALLGASLISLPLLILHVSRLADLRFALSRVLPLAGFSLGSVVAGVYLEDHRILVLLGMVVLVIAYTTVTYRDWSGRRQVHAEERGRRWERERRERELDKHLRPIEEWERRAGLAAAAARRALAEVPAGFTLEGGDVNQALDDLHLGRAQAEARALRDLSGLAALDQQAHASATAGRLAAIEERAPELERQLGAVSGALGALERAVAQARERERRQTQTAQQEEHCLACGAASIPATRYCQECGTVRPVALGCERCGGQTQVPAHLCREDWRGRPLHCQRCGEALIQAGAAQGEPAVPKPAG